MAWNGSVQAPQPTETPKRRGNRSFARICIGLVALVGVSAVGLMAWQNFTRPGRKAKTEPNVQPAARIAEVEPALPKESHDSEQVEEPPQPKPLPPQRVGEVRNGKLLMLSGELRTVKGVITSSVYKTSIVHQTFKRAANQQIASILMIEPGNGMLGSSEELFEGFGERFDESLKEEIKITPEDSDLQRELKQAVLDARNDLIARRNKGEDVAQIMIDTRNQLMELGTYKDDLEKQVERLSSDGNMSDEDYEELLKAANVMLEERGAKPFELPSVVKHSVNLQKLNNTEGEDDE